MIYRVTHTTTYAYSEPVSLCHNLVHLTPRNDPGRAALRTAADRPAPAVPNEHVDLLRQPCDVLHHPGAAPELTVTAISHDPR